MPWCFYHICGISEDFNWKFMIYWIIYWYIFIRYFTQQLQRNFKLFSLVTTVFRIFLPSCLKFSSLIIWVAKNIFLLFANNSVRIISIVLLESGKIHINVLMCTGGWCRKFLQCPFVFSERSEPIMRWFMGYEYVDNLHILYSLCF